MNMTLPGYVIFRELSRDLKYVIYRGIRESDQTPVLIKTLSSIHPNLEDVARLKNEYDLLSSLTLPTVVKAYALESYQNNYSIILEDAVDMTLDKLLRLHTLDIVSSLKIAINITKALGDLQANEIIHKDIQPQNILVNPETLEVTLTGFTYATKIPRQRFSVKNPSLLEGTLAYMSPEQTGRMNRDVDYRTDFYSLGITFYKLFTNQLPFKTLDPMELVHAHIARTPPSPHQIAPNIPLPLSDIIMKLISKKADDRYSNSYSLLHDLELCLEEYQKTGDIAPFPLGRRDMVRKLQISQKIYGREKEITRLLEVFDEACQGTTQMMLVAGYAGIGKTSLVNEIHKPIIDRKGIFISGKFDQYKKNIPYNAFIEAFQDLVQQILTENDETIAKWRERLKEALGNNAPVILELLPELQYIIGERPPSQEFDTQETQNRFNFFFQKFIALYATPETPLVIHLDDLQWIDPASLQLIEIILTTLKPKALFLIGSYRNNETTPLHPLITATQRIIKNGGAITEIELPPLKQEDVNHLIADTLHISLSECETLAKIVADKTQGNPFFINQLLLFLYEEKLLNFDVSEGKWTWSEEKIAALNVSENVIDLLIIKLQKCSLETQEILKIASCIGTQFDVRLVAKIAGKTIPQVMVHLMEAIQDGFILPSEDVLFYLWSDSKELAEMMQYKSPQAFRFLHDKVLQAAYTMLNEESRKKYHLKIGQLLLQKYSDHERDQHIFEIMAQLNSAKELITDEKERKECAQMNLMAGSKAMRSVAYGMALTFLKSGLEFLPQDKWNIYYDLTFQIFLASAECEYLLLNFDEASRLFDLIMEYAKTVHEKVQIDTLKVKLYVSSIKYDEAIKFGRDGLKLLGVELPSKFHKLHILKEFLILKAKLLTIDLENVKNLPTVTNQEHLDLLNLMAYLVTPAYLTKKELFAWVVIKGLNLTLKYGNAPTSGYLYACYGILMNALFEDFKASFAFGQLALELNRKFEDQKWVGPTKSFVGTFLNHTQNHLRTSVHILQTGYEMSTSIGDFNTAVFCLGMMIVDKYLIGDNIDELLEQIKESIDYSVKVKSHNRGYVFIALRQSILALKGLTKAPESMSNETFDEEEFFKALIDNNFLITLYFAYTFKIQLCYMAEDYEMVVELGKKTDELTFCALGQPMRIENDFYHALGLAANYSQKEQSTQKEYIRKIKGILKRLHNWARSIPSNNLHKYLLVKAELARIEGRKDEAIEAYDQAIASAKENGYIQNEAIASELFAKFYLFLDKHHLVKQYLLDAHYSYYRWGANGKVADLEKKYPAFFPFSSVKTVERRHAAAAEAGEPHAPGVSLDLMAVIKTSHSISSEIVLEKLLAQLLKILVETAGAQKAALILEKEGSWVVEAERSEEIGGSPLIGSIPLKDKKNDLSTAIVNFVLRTKEQVVLDDAANESIFIADPYISEKKPQSILCFPLLHQGKLIGALYLENNLTTKAFTPERVELLKLLTTQISTSLENSLLYLHQAKLTDELKVTNEKLEDYSHNLERRVYERTRELNEKNKQLEDTLVQIKEMQKQLIQQEKLVSLGAVTKSIATEMRTPLNYIYNFAQLSSGLIDELKQAFPQKEPSEILSLIHTNLDKIYEHSKKADEILTSMLQSSRDIETVRELTDINKLIRDYADLVYYSYYKKDPLFSLTIETNYDPSVGKISVYPQNLGRVFYNIIDNACYATDIKKGELKGDFSPIVSISTKSETDSVVIKIRDNGIGIPKEVLSRIFSPFLTTKPQGKGAGMGLSISYDIIVQDHNGTIDVQSEIGKFTEVTITLPKA